VPLTCDYEEAFAVILTLQDTDQLLQGLLAVDEFALLVLGQAVVSGTNGSEHLDRWHVVSITLQKKGETFSHLLRVVHESIRLRLESGCFGCIIPHFLPAISPN